MYMECMVSIINITIGIKIAMPVKKLSVYRSLSIYIGYFKVRESSHTRVMI